MSKHTKGPWSLIELNESFRIGSSNNQLIAYAEYGFSEPTEGDLTDEEANANARLIAAAPELLDALTSLYSKFRNDGLGKDKWYGSIMELAKAAIAKATGEKEPAK